MGTATAAVTVVVTATIALRDMRTVASSMITVVGRGVARIPAAIITSAERNRLAHRVAAGAVVVVVAVAVSDARVAASPKNAWHRLRVRLWQLVPSRLSVSVKTPVNGPVKRESGF